MERYVGVLKNMVNLMSDIDTNLANRAISMECIHTLPPQPPLYDLSTIPNRDHPFPSPPLDTSSEYRIVTPAVLALARSAYPDQTPEQNFPISAARLKLFRRFYLRWKCTIGSEQAQNRQIQHRRDDSYVWWYTRDRRQKMFGRVVIYVIAYTYKAIAVVKAFERVEEVRELDIVTVRGGLGAMETVPISYIGGLIGRIESSDDRGKIIYLTRNCSREQDSVDE